MSVSRELKRQVRRYEPCLPRPANQPPAGPGSIHEIKHDGFRILAELDGGRARLITRKGFDLAQRFPLAAAAIAALPARSWIVDSEAIACDANGLSPSSTCPANADGMDRGGHVTAKLRPISWRWIWFVPSQICVILASRISRSTR